MVLAFYVTPGIGFPETISLIGEEDENNLNSKK